MRQETLTRLHQIIEPHEENSRALVDYDITIYSYGDLRLALDDASTQFRENGVKAGDRVLLIVENSATAVAFILAASRTDAWVVLVNSRLTETEITRLIAHARPRIAIFAIDASDEARRHAQRANAITVAGRFGTVAISTLQPPNPEPVQEGRAQVAVMLYTTGTTGQPMGVMLTHGNLLFGSAVSGALRVMTHKDKLFAASPITHVFGLASVVMAGLRVGGCVHLCNRFSPRVLYQDLVREGITVLPAVPQMHAALMQYLREQEVEWIENHQLRYVSSGGAPLDPAWKRAVEKFIGLPLQNGYGLTETRAGVCATNTAEFTDDVSVGCKEPIVRSGFNVFPPEVEGNEEVIAFVQPAAGAHPDEATLKAHAASQLAGYKFPTMIIVQDKLPATATGKILKAELIGILDNGQINYYSPPLK